MFQSLLNIFTRKKNKVSLGEVHSIIKELYDCHSEHVTRLGAGLRQFELVYGDWVLMTHRHYANEFELKVSLYVTTPGRSKKSHTVLHHRGHGFSLDTKNKKEMAFGRFYHSLHGLLKETKALNQQKLYDKRRWETDIAPVSQGTKYKLKEVFLLFRKLHHLGYEQIYIENDSYESYCLFNDDFTIALWKWDHHTFDLTVEVKTRDESRVTISKIYGTNQKVTFLYHGDSELHFYALLEHLKRECVRLEKDSNNTKQKVNIR